MQVQHAIANTKSETDCDTEKAKQMAENINKSGGKAIAVPGIC
jgi:hypothetical protein